MSVIYGKSRKPSKLEIVALSGQIVVVVSLAEEWSCAQFLRLLLVLLLVCLLQLETNFEKEI